MNVQIAAVLLLLYGCGLRVSECLNLRVQCFNFDARVLTVHDGKGQKDRTVPLPETILPELQAQLEGDPLVTRRGRRRHVQLPVDRFVALAVLRHEERVLPGNPLGGHAIHIIPPDAG